MLAKTNLLLPTFARQERETNQKPLTHKQWVSVDRIVMAVLFVITIAGAIIFS